MFGKKKVFLFVSPFCFCFFFLGFFCSFLVLCFVFVLYFLVFLLSVFFDIVVLVMMFLFDYVVVPFVLVSFGLFKCFLQKQRMSFQKPCFFSGCFVF